MRMRPKKNRTARMEKVSDLLAVLDENGVLDLEKSFSVKKNLIIEIGCGKGAFITGLASVRRDENLLAVELVPDVLMMAMEKASRAGIECVRFLNADAASLESIVPKHSVSEIYLNFSDPWPKKRNAKRRLTSPSFLAIYKKLLAPEGKIYFKTDNKPLFDYSLETFSECGYTLKNVCFDLHGDVLLSADNIETEYEKNFSQKGFPINYLEAYPPKDNPEQPDARQTDT